MQRAEWIDYAAAFFNLEALSNQVFADIRAEYECHADNGELYVRAARGGRTPGKWATRSRNPSAPPAKLSHAQPASERPLVAWTSYQYAYWANNTEYWEVSQATYKLELAEDAGAARGLSDHWSVLPWLTHPCPTCPHRPLWPPQGRASRCWRRRRWASSST